MSRLICSVCFIAVFLFFVSCTAISTHDQFLSMEGGGMVHTNAEVYMAEVFSDGREGVRFDISYTVTNTTDEAIYMIGCKRPSAPVLQRRSGGEWVTAFSPVEQLCLSPPFIVEPGEQRNDTLHVYAFFPGQNIYPEYLTEVEGTYRLDKRIYSNPETFDNASEWSENKVSRELRISNSFEVKKK